MVHSHLCQVSVHSADPSPACSWYIILSHAKSNFGQNDKILTPNGPSLGLPNEERRLNSKPIPNPNAKFKLGNLGFWRLVQNMTIDYIICIYICLHTVFHKLALRGGFVPDNSVKLWDVFPSIHFCHLLILGKESVLVKPVLY